MLKVSKRKTIKIAAQIATFTVVTACMAAAYKEYIPAEYANNLAVRLGKAILYYAVVSASINYVSHDLDDAFNETK